MTIKISQLQTIGAVQGNTIVPIVGNVAGTLTTLQSNVSQLQTYIVGTAFTDIANLYANTIATAYSFANVWANLNNVATSLSSLNSIESSANIGMHGYVDNAISTNVSIVNASISTANLALKGYVDFANTIQSAQINAANLASIAANVGMIGYVGQQVTAANVGMKGYVDNQTYSNVKVSQYLPTYSGNIGALGITGSSAIYGVLAVGFPSPITFGNVVVNAVNNANSYVQLNIQNINSFGNLVSADFIATAPDGTDTSKYIDMGINGNNFSSSAWTISGADDGYLYVNSGNLTVGTDTPGTTVKVHVGGTLASNVVATFTNNSVTVTGNVIVSGKYIKLTPSNVANLVSASTAGAGAKAFVTDANSNTFANLVVGGGIYNVPVFSNGTNWYIG